MRNDWLALLFLCATVQFSVVAAATRTTYRLDPFTLQDDGSGRTLTIDLSSLGANRQVTVPNKGGTFAYTSDLDFAAGTWSPTVSNIVGFTGTPSVDSAFFIRIGDMVACVVKVRGLTTAGSVTAHNFDVSLPVAPGSGNFGGNDGAAGIVEANVAAVNKPSDVGIINSVSGTQNVRLDVYNNEIGASQSVAVVGIFVYDAS